MDLLIISASVLAIGAVILIIQRSAGLRAIERDRLINEVRTRSKDREYKNGQSAICHKDINHSGYDFSLSMSEVEVHDRWDGRDLLDTIQMSTIGLIMDGYRPEIKPEVHYTCGPTPLFAAGASMAGSIFDDHNLIIVDGVAVMSNQDAWSDTVQ